MQGFALRLDVQSPSLCPQIRLALLSPSVDLGADTRDVLGEFAPFWAFAWAGGQVLARYVLDHPGCVRGRSVLDLGCGSGLVGIAAAVAGAERVVVCDCDPAALEAAGHNAALNGVELRAESEPAQAVEGCDVLLAADVLYEPQTAEDLERAASRVELALVSDPGRKPTPPLVSSGRLEPVWEREARTLPEIDEETSGATVYRVMGRNVAATVHL